MQLFCDFTHPCTHTKNSSGSGSFCVTYIWTYTQTYYVYLYVAQTAQQRCAITLRIKCWAQSDVHTTFHVVCIFNIPFFFFFHSYSSQIAFGWIRRFMFVSYVIYLYVGYYVCFFVCVTHFLCSFSFFVCLCLCLCKMPFNFKQTKDVTQKSPPFWINTQRIHTENGVASV